MPATTWVVIVTGRGDVFVNVRSSMLPCEPAVIAIGAAEAAVAPVSRTASTSSRMSMATRDPGERVTRGQKRSRSAHPFELGDDPGRIVGRDQQRSPVAALDQHHPVRA